jgi:hypothetical protein
MTSRFVGAESCPRLRGYAEAAKSGTTCQPDKSVLGQQVSIGDLRCVSGGQVIGLLNVWAHIWTAPTKSWGRCNVVSITKLSSIMRGLPGTTAMSLVLASICNVQAQRSNLDEGVSDEARFPISRGDNFTFQPAAGSLCQWAVAQYPLSEKQFFVLDSQPACAPVAGNASTTLRLQFGDEIAPGNATLTVQCKEPSVWKFIINDDEPERGGKTVLDSVCYSGDIPSNKDGFGGGWQNGSNAGSRGGSVGAGSPSGSPSLPGQRGNWSHDMPTSLSAPSSSFSNGLSQGSNLASNPASNPTSNPASNPASNQASNPSNKLTGGDPSGVDTVLTDTNFGIPTSIISGRPSLHTDDAAEPATTGTNNPASGPENDLPSAQVPRGSLGAVPVTTDQLPTLQPTTSNPGEASAGDTNASATEQPFGPTAGPLTSTPAGDSQASTTGALPSSCVCTC